MSEAGPLLAEIAPQPDGSPAHQWQAAPAHQNGATSGQRSAKVGLLHYHGANDCGRRSAAGSGSLLISDGLSRSHGFSEHRSQILRLGPIIITPDSLCRSHSRKRARRLAKEEGITKHSRVSTLRPTSEGSA